MKFFDDGRHERFAEPSHRRCRNRPRLCVMVPGSQRHDAAPQAIAQEESRSEVWRDLDADGSLVTRGLDLRHGTRFGAVAGAVDKGNWRGMEVNEHR